MSRTALVTGGTGFVGLNLIELLVEEGWEVTALHRSTSYLSYLKRFPITLVEGSITDPNSLEKALQKGTEVVFHVAGDTNFWSKHNARQTEINVTGTRNMVKAAVDKKVNTFIPAPMIEFIGEFAGLMKVKTPVAVPAIVLQVMSRLTSFVANFTNIEPSVTPEMASMTARKGVTFSSQKAMEELGLQLPPWKAAVKDNYDWLVKEGLL